MRIKPPQNRWKGFLAGALAGLAASFAMSQFHALFQKAESSAAQKEEDSTVRAASAISESIFHHHLTSDQKQRAGPAVHYSFGASVAAIYGAAAEFIPLVRTGWGLLFGAAVWLGAHVITVPALGLSEPVTQSTPRKEAVEFGAHLLYGAVVEGLRRSLRASVLR
jgi:putative membrane protein